ELADVLVDVVVVQLVNPDRAVATASAFGWRGAGFVALAGFVAEGVNRGDDVVVGRAGGHGEVGVFALGDERAVELRVGAAGRRGAIDVVAGQVAFRVVGPLQVNAARAAGRHEHSGRGGRLFVL